MARIKTQGDVIHKLAKKILSWLIYARRVLSIAQLQHAVAVEPNTQQLDEEFIPDKEMLGSICAGLVIFDAESNAVRLAHYTIQEYFERDGKSWFQDAEADIATACMTYISFHEFEDWCASMADILQRKQKYPLYQYAIKFFGEHARAGPETMQLKQLVLDFLGNDHKMLSVVQAIGRLTVKGTAIHLAAFFGVERIITHFLENGCNINERATGGWTPLHWAAEGECTGAIKLLIDRGAEINPKDINGRTPLSWACYHGKKDVMKLLLENGADFGSADNSGKSPLEVAVQYNRQVIVKLLLENGADAKSNKNGRTLLYSAIENNYEGVVKLLLENGAEVKNDEYGGSPLEWAMRHYREGLFKLLLEHGADASSTNDAIELLNRAIQYGHKGIVRLLLEYGADANMVVGGVSPLTRAIHRGDEGIARLLLEHGADVNHDKMGSLLLSQAILYGRENMVKLLLEIGANPDVVGRRYDYSCLPDSLAREERLRDERIQELLREYSGKIEDKSHLVLKH